MRRFVTLILAVFYMASAIGATVHLHYCMGKLAGARLINYDEDQTCSRCGMKKSKERKGCCHDKSMQLRAADHHLVPHVFFQCAPMVALQPPNNYFLQETNPSDFSLPQSVICAHAPPDRAPHCPIYIQLRNLRI